jgi:hypothetical protein
MYSGCGLVGRCIKMNKGKFVSRDIAFQRSSIALSALDVLRQVRYTTLLVCSVEGKLLGGFQAKTNVSSSKMRYTLFEAVVIVANVVMFVCDVF